MPTVTNSLSERVSSGEPAAVARAISKIEDGADGAAALMKEIYQRSRGALVIGITGAPGAGKSSLVDKLAMFYRKNGERVGIVAVDPSSPFSGGAILGARIGRRRFHPLHGHPRQSRRPRAGDSRCRRDSRCCWLREDHHRDGWRRS